MKNLLFTVLIGVAIILFVNVLYLSFNQQPNIELWSWFGYKFGINWSDYTMLKIGSIIVMLSLAMIMAMREEQKIENQN